MPNCSDDEQSVRSQAENPSTMALEVADLVRHHRGGGGINGISLAVPAGETLAILGPSGAGKSTLVNLVVGIESPDAGRVLLNGTDVTTFPPGRRNLAAVFQDIPLYDHLDAVENVRLATSSLRLSRAKTSERVDEAISAVEADKLRNRRAATLSGGERARIAIARVLARRPSVVLLDEPYAAIDQLFRVPLRRLISEKLADVGAAVVHVTHSTEEALDVANRIAVIADGDLRQIDTPDRIRAQPADELVAALFTDQTK